TVIGVTITFAAIAAAGDVNINSIAPGVAAALTTTIAGLFVAIPALFGYNYLVIRIRDIVTEMQVFNDEFVTKTTEFYSKKGNMGDRFEDDHQAEEQPSAKVPVAPAPAKS
ncbi:MotA/TolQ/ExbB proton channel family protein, partial [Arthrospira platensis SPKY1]|nr:MotA/TolQ/ExbB proton channel family protein [Arthrospira platensis SPKY1]